MIKRITFENFRNLNTTYEFNETLNVIVGKNNSGKTNVLDGIRIAFSSFTGDYIRVKKSDFNDSNDSRPFKIKVDLEKNAIPSLNYQNENDEERCGFCVTYKKLSENRYSRRVTLGNGTNFDEELTCTDPKLPNVCMIPLIRSEDLYSDGLIAGISHFIDSEEEYKGIIEESKKKIKDEMGDKIKTFQAFCKKFDQTLDIDFTEPRLIDEKAYIVDGEKEHRNKIGSGYKSIANIILNTLNDRFNIILIDEIENHLHPSLIRTLIRELRGLKNVLLICTTHSPVVVNEVEINELINISGESFSKLDETTKNKLVLFLHPGRAEIVFAENVILVEGYTEELIFKHYLSEHNDNWTVVNVVGVMFEPYIMLALFLNKKVIVISDNDIALSGELEPSKRFQNLRAFCESNSVKLFGVHNTLETDLYETGLLVGLENCLEPSEKHKDILIAKPRMKTFIAQNLIAGKRDLSNWKLIQKIEDELKSN